MTLVTARHKHTPLKPPPAAVIRPGGLGAPADGSHSRTGPLAAPLPEPAPLPPPLQLGTNRHPITEEEREGSSATACRPCALIGGSRR